MNVYQYTLPNYEQFTLLNSIILKPPCKRREEKAQKETLPDPIKSKKGLILNDSKFEKEIKFTLRQIANHHISRFETICDSVILNKYEAIYSQIVTYMNMLQYSTSKDFFHAMIINTDQNSSSFFEGLTKFLQSKTENGNETSNSLGGKKIFPKGESHFKDLSKLFKDLNLELDFDDNKTIPIARLIVIGEIQRIDQIVFNIFLKRLIEYDQLPYKQYSNILIFDVSYDPRNLLDKIKVNVLSKMVLHQIDNVPSKNIYKEVLYRYIYEQSNGLFIPNSKHTKIIVDYINNHQISISSFQHYFKFSILAFFLMHSWDDDEYLLFSPELEQSAQDGEGDKVIWKFFKRKLKKIYGSNSSSSDNAVYHLDDIAHLEASYIKHCNNKSLFFEFYRMFETIMSRLANEFRSEYEPFDKFQFFFEFLQYDYADDGNTDNSKNINQRSSRITLIEKYFKKFPKEDYMILINEYLLPEYKTLVALLCKKNNAIEKELYTKLTMMVKRLQEIGNEDIDNDNDKEDEVIGSKTIHNRFKTTKEIFNRLLHWLEMLLDNNIFDIINDFDKDQTIIKKRRKWINSYKNYFDFSEVVNPSLGLIIMKALSHITEKGKKTTENNNNNDNSSCSSNATEDKLNFEYIVMVYINCFKKMGSTFRLKLFFIEFLTGMDVSIDNEKTIAMQNQLKIIFLYVSYAFCLIGLFSKKKGMGNDVYMKNYFLMTDYYRQ